MGIRQDLLRLIADSKRCAAIASKRLCANVIFLQLRKDKLMNANGSPNLGCLIKGHDPSPTCKRKINMDGWTTNCLNCGIFLEWSYDTPYRIRSLGRGCEL